MWFHVVSYLYFHRNDLRIASLHRFWPGGGGGGGWIAWIPLVSSFSFEAIPTSDCTFEHTLMSIRTCSLWTVCSSHFSIFFRCETIFLNLPWSSLLLRSVWTRFYKNNSQTKSEDSTERVQAESVEVPLFMLQNAEERCRQRTSAWWPRSLHHHCRSQRHCCLSEVWGQCSHCGVAFAFLRVPNSPLQQKPN